jgi:nicotinamide-nucleotide amidase
MMSQAAQLGALLQQQNACLTSAESCTGGWIAQTITSVTGSSRWFDRGFVTYSNAAKQQMLGVKTETLQQFGAVSEQTVREMAIGALKRSEAHISLAVSGIAGPDGGTVDKPVGTVWFAWAFAPQRCDSVKQQFAGDRQAIRQQAVEFALNYLIKKLQATPVE